jgi:pyruvate dehydrogenase E1 component beta subunit
MVIVEEAWPLGNISTEIITHCQEHAFDYLDAPIIRINTADTPMAYAPTLVNEFLPNAARVITAVKKVMYK